MCVGKLTSNVFLTAFVGTDFSGVSFLAHAALMNQTFRVVLLFFKGLKRVMAKKMIRLRPAETVKTLLT